jgi:hypothetical protein|nr:MAG TPA: hydrogenase/urease nickel incorporation protein [Caudoviricetes sp.]
MKMKGNDKCFDCGATFEWGDVPRARNGQVIAYMIPDVRADITAIGRENDKVKWEVLCTCPKCGTKNKYIKLA